MAKFRPNLGQFWPKRAIFQISLKNQRRNIFWTAEARLPAKIRKFQRAVFEKNAKNPPFLGVLGQKRRFWTIFGQKEAIFEFSVKKRKRHFFTHFFSFFNTKNQKILMRGFSGKWARTNVWTNGGESKGPSTPSRDQKSDNFGEPI